MVPLSEDYLRPAGYRPGSARHFRGLRRTCEARLAAVQGARPVHDVLSLRDRLSDQRGKPIQLVPMAIPGHEVNGMWIATAVADVVVYEARTTRAHQEHIIAHELAHILCGHRAVTAVADDALGQLFPDLSPAIVRRALLRTVYSDRKEQEAEMTASLLLSLDTESRSCRPCHPPAPGPDDARGRRAADSEVVSRLRAAVVGAYAGPVR